MTEKPADFVKNLPAPLAPVAKAMRQAIRKGDKAVIEKTGAYMNAKNALIYSQGAVAKYALTQTGRGLTFHSLVIYANPDIAQFIKQRLTGVKTQKGCFNVTAPEAFDMDGFSGLIARCARKDFQPIIDHYARIAKRRPKAKNAAAKTAAKN